MGVSEISNRELCFESVHLLLAVLQLLSGLVSLKLGLGLKLVEGVLQRPVLLQELLPLQPGKETRSARRHINTSGVRRGRGVSGVVLTGLCRAAAEC